MAKLYFNPEDGTVVAKRDHEANSDLIEVTPEQGAALSLSFIGQAISQIYDILEDKLGGLPPPPAAE